MPLQPQAQWTFTGPIGHIKQARLIMCCLDCEKEVDWNVLVIKFGSKMEVHHKLPKQHFHWKPYKMRQANLFYSCIQPVTEYNLHLGQIYVKLVVARLIMTMMTTLKC